MTWPRSDLRARVDLTFPSMGGEAVVRLESGALDRAALEQLLEGVHARVETVEAALSRFRPGSELNVLNADPRTAVPACPLLQRTVATANWAAARSGGLVDATLLGALERHGYEASWDAVRRADIDAALAAAPPRRPAGPARRHGDGGLRLDSEGRVVRAPGVRLDPGGIAKGMAADIAAAALPSGVRYAISCGGDVAVGGGEPWGLAVRSARGDAEVHRLRVRAGGVATSGIAARIWRRADAATPTTCWTRRPAGRRGRASSPPPRWRRARSTPRCSRRPPCCRARSSRGGCCAFAAVCSSTTTAASRWCRGRPSCGSRTPPRPDASAPWASPRRGAGALPPRTGQSSPP
jgi:FAD:protein FMN transferase